MPHCTRIAISRNAESSDDKLAARGQFGSSAVATTAQTAFPWVVRGVSQSGLAGETAQYTPFPCAREPAVGQSIDRSINQGR